MTRVFLLSVEMDWEYERIVGCFDTLDAAKLAAERVTPEGMHDSLSISELRVNEMNKRRVVAVWRSDPRRRYWIPRPLQQAVTT